MGMDFYGFMPKTFLGGSVNNFEWGKVFGVVDMEDCQSEGVFRVDPKKLGKSKKMKQLHLGRVIEFDRDCSKCARHIKLQIGSDIVFLDGKPFLLDVPVQLFKGVILSPLSF